MIKRQTAKICFDLVLFNTVVGLTPPTMNIPNGALIILLNELCFSDRDRQELEAALIKLPSSINMPDEFMCPITQQIFRDPVICSGINKVPIYRR